MDREALLRREDESWASFTAEVERVPAENREIDGAVEGWSVKDLVWHCAYWAGFCGDAVSGLGSPGFRDPFEGHDDAYWDAENDRVAREGKARSWAEVLAYAADARQRARSTFGAAPDDDRATEWFSEETFEHYDEHAEQVRAFTLGA